MVFLCVSGLRAQALDVSGYELLQYDQARSYTIPGGTEIEPGGYLVIGRNADQAAFESYYGVSLASNVVYLNAANGFPRIDGSETFELQDASSGTVDGPSAGGLDTRKHSVQRVDASASAGDAANWHVVVESASTPGTGGAGTGSGGLVINEFSDSSSFFYEFVELFYYDGAISNTPPVLQALPDRVVTLNQDLEFNVEAAPTDGDTVTLSVSNAPFGATFSSTNENGFFRWTGAAPVGVYTMQVYAADKDGVDMEEVVISVAGAPDVSFAIAESFLNEDAGTQQVAVVLSRSADATVHFSIGSGTASQGVDYAVSSTTVVFTASGDTQQYISVVITDDDNMEGLETVVFSLESAVGAIIVEPDEHILSIRDNETITVMAANLVSGYPSVYQDPAWRILQALKPDIVGMQECVYTNESMRDFVDQFFGPEYDFYIEPQSSAYFPQPNAIISRWPIVDAGEWSDPVAANRDFAWATIDIPGDRDMHVISLHLYYSGTEEDRVEEARALTNYIAQAGFSENDYLVIAGDLNAADRSEPCLAVLTNIVSDGHKPADQFGDTTTSRNREYTFDFVLPNENLEANHYITTVQGINFDDGLVFDTRLWTNIPPPALTNDSAADGNAHMAVMKSFSQGRTPPSLTYIPEQRVVVGDALTFGVYARPTDGDTVTLTASNLPAGASFSATNENGTFTWPNTATVGVYECNFYASDSDGTEFRSVTIKVLVDGTVWINELHYDNAGTDVNEGVEIAGNAGMDLDFYSLAIYNGSDGLLSETIELDGYLPDEGDGFGAVWVPVSGMQNEVEGVALVKDDTNLVQFLSYEGVVVAVDGPAVEESSEAIGSESGGATDGSLQLVGLGNVYSNFTWQSEGMVASRGLLNSLQRMYPVYGTEQQPPAIYPLAPVNTVQSNSVEFYVTATDANGDAITLSVSNAPAGAGFTASGATGTFTWASAVPVGVYTTTFYAVDDDGAGSETVLITVASGRQGPFIQAVSDQAVTEYLDLVFDVMATDAEGDDITLTISNAPAGAAFSSSAGYGTFSWTNAQPIGVYTTLVYAADVDGSTSQTVIISVQAATNPPVLVPVGNRHVTQYEPLVFTVTANDPDEEVIAFSASELPAGATFTPNADSGTFSWTNPAVCGVYTTTFYAVDDDGADSETITLHVVPGGDLWINELHYDNQGTDSNEFVEIAGTAGMDLSYHQLFYYRDDGTVYASNSLSGTMPDEGCGFGAVSVDRALQQAGGVALVKDWTNLVALLSYSPTFLASNGPAAGEYSLDIKVRESNTTTPPGYSLQLEGYGTNYIGFTWAGPTNTASPGLLNENQFIYPCNGSTNLPPVLNAVGNQSVELSNTLSFAVTATEPDGEAITLSVSNNPAGSSLSATNGNGTFTWSPAAPVGVYTCTFYAASVDGADSEEITITVAEPAVIWINELHYDNSGTDTNEGVELAGPAGTVLTNYALVPYNGSDGSSYSPTVYCSGTLPDEGCGFGTAWFAMDGLQNGPDAIALVRQRDNYVVQFLSYGGSFTAVDGPAAGMTATDLGVAESDETGCSLQLTGTGDAYDDYSWSAPAAESMGLLNDGQFIYPCNGSTNVPPVLAEIGDQVVDVGGALSITISASELNGDTVTLSVSNAPAGAVLAATNENGTFTWDMITATGEFSCTFYASDVDGSDFETITITVNPPVPLWINELHYDNDGTDTNEGVEVAGAAGIALTNYVLYAYNGSDGGSYITTPLTGSIDDEGCGYGAAWFAMAGIQNGPDAIALVRSSDSYVVSFISYEGSFTATDGPATGQAAENLPVSESASTTVGYSLQLIGTGTAADDFSWTGPVAASRGLLNDGQYIEGCGDADSDADGLPDTWESRYYNDPTNAVAGVDDDSDGMSNLDEYIADTDPTNAVSLFAVTALYDTLDASVEFSTSTSRLYGVYSTTNLSDLSWVAVQTNIAGTGETITVPLTNNHILYIRARVTIP